MKKMVVFLSVFFVIAGTVMAASKTETKWMKNAQEMYAAKDYEGAAEAFEKVLAENPENTNALIYAGYSYMRAGDKQAAIKKLEAAYKKTKDEKVAGYLEKLKEKNTAPKGKNEVVGGDARTAALGGAGIVLPDISNMTDQYAMGFPSAYAFRKGNSIIYLAPVFSIASLKTKETDDDTFDRSASGFAVSDTKNGQGIALRLIENNSIILKPRFVSIGGKETTDAGAITIRNVTASLLGGDVEIAHKFGALAIGGVFGFDTAGAQSVDSSQTLNKTAVDMSKISYLGSVSYVMDLSGPEFSIALSGGTRTGHDSSVPFEINGFDYGFDAEYAKLVSRFAAKNTTSLYIPAIFLGPIQLTPPYNGVTVENTVTEGFNMGLGVDFRIQNVIEVGLSGNLAPGITVKRTKSTTWTDMESGDVVDNFLLNTWENEEYVNYRDGLCVSAAFKARYYFSDLLVIGAALDFMNLGITRIPRGDDTDTLGNPVNENLTTLDFSGGVTVKIVKGMNIPLEGFYQSGTKNEKEPVAVTDATWATSIAGLRTGVELMITEELAARLGIEYASGGASYKVVDSGTVTVDEPYGTADNPGRYKIVLAPGIGFKTGGFDINLAGRYIFSEEVTGNGAQEVETGYATKSQSDIEIIASVLLAL